jgi:hypothetical protein
MQSGKPIMHLLVSKTNLYVRANCLFQNLFYLPIGKFNLLTSLGMVGGGQPVASLSFIPFV